MPDVVLASDAPPVAASLSGEAEAPGERDAVSTSRPDRASFSIGRQLAIDVHVASSRRARPARR